MGRIIFGLLDRLWFVICVIVGAQWSGYLQAYMHQLTGHLQESLRWLNEYRAIAIKHHHDFDSLVQSLLNSKDASLIEQGNLLKSNMLRESQLQQSLDSLQSAEVWQQPFYFIKHLQPDIALKTIQDYVPTLPLTSDAIISAAIAILVLWVPVKLIIALFTRPKKSKYARRY